MASRPPKHNHGTNVDTRLSRLETIIDSMSSTLEKIQTKLDTESKINWAPVSIGVTVFLAVVGSFGAVYTTQMGSMDTHMKALAESTQSLAVASTEQRISVQTLKDRQDDMKTQVERKFDDVDKKLDDLNDEVETLKVRKR